jgi:radical SAM superfamily enzyme
MQTLRDRKLRLLYFGLESGDDQSLRLINKGFDSETMLRLCQKAQDAQMKLSVTAILGLAGRQRSREHALATADWITRLSPEYFSLLTMFRRHNDAHFTLIEQLSNGEVLLEALEIVRRLAPQKTILRSNHVSNILNLAGSYPKDRERIIAQTEAAFAAAKRQPDWFNEVPDYEETHF